jgi:probable F420-dependent oxidoreductase
MQFGLILPTKHTGANPEAILASAQAAERLGWSTVCGDDHILVPGADRAAYGTIYEILATLAWVGGQTTRIRLQPSVLVVPQRNAVVLAKELATLDRLTGGRLSVGVGLGWNVEEYRNLGMEERFHVRGAYLDETIGLWRHLWSWSEEPFDGRFHQISDAVFSPLPACAAELPIIVGGRSDRGVRRAGRLGDGYQLSQNGPSGMSARLPLLRAAAEEAGRPTPRISARAQVYFGPPPARHTAAAIHGTTDQIARAIDEWIGLGLDELLLDLDETDAAASVAKMERLHAEVLASRMPAA